MPVLTSETIHVPSKERVAEASGPSEQTASQLPLSNQIFCDSEAWHKGRPPVVVGEGRAAPEEGTAISHLLLPHLPPLHCLGGLLQVVNK